jgi:glutathione S-transferase
MKLQLFYAPYSCALVSYVALAEAGAEFTVHAVNMMRGEHTQPDYLRLNPKHQVPALVIDGEPLTENVAIQLWVARQFPAAQLLPAGGLQEFRAISIMAWCASGLHTTLTPNVLPQRYCDLPGSEESVRRCAQKLLLERLAVAEEQLTGRDWFFDRFTLPDAYFYWCFRRATQFKVELAPLVACQAHFERVAKRASVRKVLAFEAETLAAWHKAATAQA